ncbi:hypothetical protein HDA40_007554 [Hamadaea flava]|uniref:DUF998 domain-containing protein n=1 Tax=Hamadaea flava TaxID=1742688 RepID=A0ABV8LZA3_9ACTN|nr:hypothetical protein [Hamadaea flava]MCP2329047.1 hypothetical protein [Hamadaea flava]
MRPVLGLFLLAPFVGEFLLGNLTVDSLWVGVLLIPLYGCGAVLVRELGRRAGGWPTMALLAVAYALIEEGPVDQLLWTDAYAGHDYLAGPAFVPWLGMNVQTTLIIIALHAVWSISVPIALVESLTPARRTTPWLGGFGLTVVGVLYAVGCVLVFYGNYLDTRFLASPAQQIGMAVVIAGVIVAAFLLPRRIRLPRLTGRRPEPGGAALSAFFLTSAFWAPAVLVTAAWYQWVTVAAWLVVAVTGITAVSRWSRRDGWSQQHVCALAIGAAATYTWVAFPQRPEEGGPLVTDLATNVMCAAIIGVVVVLAARKARENTMLG